MRTDHHHSRVAVWTPWGAQPLRTDPAAQDELGGLSGALVIPFLPFEIEAFPASESTSNAFNDSEGESACVTADGSDPTSSGASS